MGRQRGAAVEALERTCASCGRRIEPRARWARDFEQVRWCSDACRRHGVTAEDRRLEEALRAAVRATRTSVDPAAVTGSAAEPTRRAARRLAAAGEVEVLQRGRVVDPSTAKGPIAIRAV